MNDKTVSLERRTIPLQVLRLDLQNAGVPQDYLRTLLRKNVTAKTPINELFYAALDYKKIERFFVWARKRDVSGAYVFRERQLFEAAATEYLMCGEGALALTDPGAIAHSFEVSKSMQQPNDLVYDFLLSLDIVFLSDLLDPAITGYMMTASAARLHFMIFLKAALNMSRQKIVLFLPESTKDQPPVEDRLQTAYGESITRLLLGNTWSV